MSPAVLALFSTLAAFSPSSAEAQTHTGSRAGTETRQTVGNADTYRKVLNNIFEDKKLTNEQKWQLFDTETQRRRDVYEKTARDISQDKTLSFEKRIDSTFDLAEERQKEIQVEVSIKKTFEILQMLEPALDTSEADKALSEALDSLKDLPPGILRRLER